MYPILNCSVYIYEWMIFTRDNFAMLDFSVAPVIIRMAFIFLSSNLDKLVSYVLPQTTIPYSITGLTNDLYMFCRLLWSSLYFNGNIIFKRLLAFVQSSSTCVFHLRLNENVIPRYVWWFTSDTAVLSKITGGFSFRSLLLLTIKDFVFEGENVTSHFLTTC